MRSMTYPRRTAAFSIGEQIIISLLSGAFLFCLVAGLVVSGSQLLFIGRIYPGISVAGVDLSGLTTDAAAARITAKLIYLQNGRLILQDGDKSWLVSPGQLGLFLDPQATANRAYAIGHSGGLFARLSDQLYARSEGVNLQPALIFDQRMAFQFLSSIATDTDVPMVEPSLSIQGTEVKVVQGKVGRTLDIAASLANVSFKVQSMRDGSVPLVVRDVRPLIQDVSAQADLARKILSKPLTISMPAGQPDSRGPWVFNPDKLAPMLKFERTHQASSVGYELTIDSQALGEFLTKLKDKLNMAPQNARFTFNDDTHQLEVIQPSVTGRDLDVEASLKSIQDKLHKGGHDIQLTFNFSKPAVTDKATGDELGIHELVSAQYSYFYGSSSERIQNIKAAAASFHGLLVAPGETFSMSQALGDITLENGYAEALIIAGGRTIQGVGGGVCQVSTTLFRTVFFAGFPVVERHSHAYRVSYYEKEAGNRRNTQLAGLDAAVFVPIVDFQFKNDTPSWLLMETYVSPTNSSILWKFYSTKDGRSVDWQTTGPTNVVDAPKPLYKVNPDLAKGDVKQVDYSADGSDVTITRTVSKDGSTYFQDTFQTHYEPWQAIFEYGPGTEGMPPPDSATQEPTPVIIQ